MHGNVLWCFLKQLCPLSLCQPNGLILQSDIYRISLAIQAHASASARA